ncbi:MAG: OmpA family protein [Longimicrobiales bacterium]
MIRITALHSVAALLLATANPAAPAPQEPGGDDLLTYARGVLFVSQTGLASGSAGTALTAIDGDPYRMALMNDAQGPVEFVYKLPATTRFERFAVPRVMEAPGNTTFVRSVVVSGSPDGPDEGFRPLAAFELETHATEDEVTEVAADSIVPVRWVRVRFEGGILIEPGDEGRTGIRFSEIMGYGEQDPQPLSTAFDGRWELRLTERQDLKGDPFELHQDGTTITGCVGTIRFQGTVNGRVARASGEDPATGRTGALILVADDDGSINAAVAANRGRFNARTAVEVPDPEGCGAEPPPPPVVCGTDVYVNFEFDSAVIRPESEAVVADLHARLVAENATRVQVVGHTSTEGAADYNLDLSRRRAQAVVDALVARGFDAGRVSADGMGETRPLISPDDNESARELNRRVRVTCGG